MNLTLGKANLCIQPQSIWTYNMSASQIAKWKKNDKLGAHLHGINTS